MKYVQDVATTLYGFRGYKRQKTKNKQNGQRKSEGEFKMAEEKVFGKGRMNDEELDNVVGGTGYAYFTKGTKDGQAGYYVMKCMTRYTTQAQVLAKYNDSNAMEEIVETSNTPDGGIHQHIRRQNVMKFFIPEAEAGAFVERCKNDATVLLDFNSFPKE